MQKELEQKEEYWKQTALRVRANMGNSWYNAEKLACSRANQFCIEGKWLITW